MKPIAALAPLLFLAACATTLPKPVAPPPAFVPPPPPVVADWRDLPVSPGRWRYVARATDSSAEFIQADGAVALTIRCLLASRTISLARSGAGAGDYLITTSYGGRAFPGAAAGGTMAISLPAADKFLDMVAFSRGRVSIAAPGAALLVVPAWAEPARVIEDCRA